MTSVLARASLRHLRRHPAQLALAVLGVALGVAVVVGIDTASASAKRAFRIASRALGGDATHVVRGSPSGVPEDLYAELVLDPRTPPAAPVIERTLALADTPGRALDLLGVDPLAEAPFRAWIAREHQASPAATALLAGGARALLLDTTATALGLRAGDQLALVVGSARKSVELAGTITAADALGRNALADLAVVDIAAAQELLAMPGRLSRIDLRLADEPELRARQVAQIESLLPSDCRLEPASARAASMESMTRAFEVNLRALSLLALLVGVFLVYDTITFTVVQRRALWGTLRALGVTRGEVLRLVCTEALLIGATGTLLGLVMGIGLAQVLVKLVTQSINDLYFVVNVRELALEPSVLVQSAVLGVAATLAGAFVPAREATQTQPRTALDRSAPESSMRRKLLPMALAGVAIACAMLVLLGISSTSLELAFVALLGTLVGAALLVPAVTVLACKIATPLFGALGGQLGRVAARGVSSHLARTAVAIAALAITLSATAGMGIMVGSFRGTVARWLERQLAADVYVSAQHLASSRDRGTLAPELVERMRSGAAVVAGNGFRDLVLDAEDGTQINASAADLCSQGRAAYQFLRGEPAQVWAAFDTRDALIVSESLARHRGLDLGSQLSVRTASGPREFAVAGVFRDFSSDRGLALMSPATAERHFGAGDLSAVGLFLAPGSDPEQVVANLRALVRPGEIVRITSRGGLLAASLEIFDRTFEVTRVLRLLACTVAFLGVLCSLLAIELEREREFGVLRAVGLTPGELRGVVLGQTALMGAIAGLIALPIGIALSLILIFSINARAFGWTLELEIPPGVLVETLALAIGAALLAGIWPAWRMSRVAPARALRAD